MLIINDWKPLAITKSSFLDDAAVLDPPLVTFELKLINFVLDVHVHVFRTCN